MQDSQTPPRFTMRRAQALVGGPHNRMALNSQIYHQAPVGYSFDQVALEPLEPQLSTTRDVVTSTQRFSARPQAAADDFLSMRMAIQWLHLILRPSQTSIPILQRLMLSVDHRRGSYGERTSRYRTQCILSRTFCLTSRGNIGCGRTVLLKTRRPYLEAAVV